MFAGSYLRLLDLPGVDPADWVTFDMEASVDGSYSHGKGSRDEWSLTWTKVDSET
jgi:hypothetical protein